MSRRLFFLILAMTPATLAGCGAEKKSSAPNEPSQSDLLMEVIGLIRNHTAAKGKGPQKIADLAPYETEYQHGFAAAKSGDIVIVWGSTVAGEGGGGGKTVVAYLKAVPESGGEVALEDGTIAKMSAGELASALKAGKK